MGSVKSSSWLRSESPPPVTPLTITLSELFLLVCGKMVERKCVYTVILLSVCVQFDLDQNFFVDSYQDFFFFSNRFLFLSLPTHIFFLSGSHTAFIPLPITSDRRGRPDRYSDSMVSDPLLNTFSFCSRCKSSQTVTLLGPSSRRNADYPLSCLVCSIENST